MCDGSYRIDKILVTVSSTSGATRLEGWRDQEEQEEERGARRAGIMAVSVCGISGKYYNAWGPVYCTQKQIYYQEVSGACHLVHCNFWLWYRGKDLYVSNNIQVLINKINLTTFSHFIC